MLPKNVELPHHHSLVNRSYTLSKAIPVLSKPHKHATPNQYANCPYNHCLCTSSDGVACNELINCDAVPKHFQMHSIKDLKREAVVACRWQGCEWELTRHNYARHIREHHLGHVRGVGHQIQTSEELNEPN